MKPRHLTQLIVLSSMLCSQTMIVAADKWEGKISRWNGHQGTWKRLLKEYSLTHEQALAYRENPIDVLAPIAAAEVPLLHIVSLNDQVVPAEENTFVLAERYRALGGKIDVIKVSKGTEKSKGHHFTHPDPRRVANFIKKHAGAGSAISRSKDQREAREGMRRATVDLSKVTMIKTAKAYHHSNPPPWPTGNQLTFSSKRKAQSGLPPGKWRLLNMHSENFGELVKRRRFESLELALLDNHRCFVVDSRVPRDWLLISPLGCSLPQRLSLKTRFPGLFEKDPQAGSLVGTTWVLVSRKDPDGLLERVLPGDRINFGTIEMTCAASSGKVSGRRSYEFSGSNKSSTVGMGVYDVRSNDAYTGATLKITRYGGQVVLFPTAIIEGNATGGFGWEVYEGPATATYRVER